MRVKLTLCASGLACNALFAVPLDSVESFTLAGSNPYKRTHEPNTWRQFASRSKKLLQLTAGNSLTSVPDGYFNRLPNLTNIDLSFNEGIPTKIYYLFHVSNNLVSQACSGWMKASVSFRSFKSLESTVRCASYLSIPPQSHLPQDAPLYANRRWRL